MRIKGLRLEDPSLAVLTLMLLLFSGAAHSQELRYALFTSGPTGGFHTSGVVPAIELAEELINADSSILPGYNLTHTPVVDTMCDRTESLGQYFGTVFSPNPTVLGLLGCGCSVASTPVAEIIQFNSISQIAYVSSSIELSDRSRFPNFFRTYPSDADFAPAVVTLIEKYGWRQMGFITQDEGLFTEAFSRIEKALRNVRVRNTVIPSEIPISTIRTNGRSFFFEDSNTRVFFINTYSDMARQIICEASLRPRGYSSPNYVWMTYGWYEENWWKAKVNPEQVPADCTDSHLAEFLHGSMVLQLVPTLNDSNSMTDTGLTPQEFETIYRTRLEEPESKANNYTFVFLATVAYDALWTFALALNKTNEMVGSLTREDILNKTQCRGSDGLLVPLENFTYSNQLMGCIIRWNLEETDFVGVSGRVEFNDGTRIQPTVQLFQYRLQNDVLLRINFGQTIHDRENQSRELIFINGESNSTIFPGGIPMDGIPITEITTYHLSLVVVYYVLAAVGLAFTTACLIFNFTQRNKKVVKLTSPNINYFVILGAYIQFTTIYFRLLPSTDLIVNEARCIISSLLIISGYCFGYGAILAKMGRIYYIFNNPTTSKKTVTDWKLSLVVLFVAGFGILLTILQVSVPELRPTPDLRINDERGNNTVNEFGIRIEYMSYQCYVSSNVPQTAMLALLFAYLALLQIIGIILAIQTRKVKIKLLNDSKYIAALIYTSSLVLILIGVISFTATRIPNIGEALTSGGLWVVTVLFLSLVFIPKMVSLYRDPNGENVFQTSNTDPHASAKMERALSKTFSKREFDNSLMKENGLGVQTSSRLSGHSPSPSPLLNSITEIVSSIATAPATVADSNELEEITRHRTNGIDH
ncbi:gamma-aminobutyric acid type B receptor subunit 2-like [Halichondria panicea]|uniref:gamma-aminobutyric acid type B receptor subunit 2-like n=1 Tax=Halichondria panicea TaxID=6063 RepID=UPI00312B8F12